MHFPLIQHPSLPIDTEINLVGLWCNNNTAQPIYFLCLYICVHLHIAFHVLQFLHDAVNLLLLRLRGRDWCQGLVLLIEILHGQAPPLQHCFDLRESSWVTYKLKNN